MASYKIEFKAAIHKDLKPLPRKDVLRILSVIKTLASDPYPQAAQKLTGRQVWRLRTRRYRILYTVDKQRAVILIIKIGHRKAVCW